MSRAALVMVLVALVVGGVLGYTVAPGPRTVPEDSSVAEESAPREPERRPRVEPAAPVLPDATLEQVAAKYPVPKFETGDGEITGSVRTAAGEPVAGVRIVARRRMKNTPKLDRNPSLADKIRRTIEQHHFAEQTKRETVSGSDGSFRLTGLADASHWLSASSDGHTVHSRGNSHQVKPGTTVEFVAEPVCRAEFEILMPDGTPAVSASLELRGEGSTRGLHWSPGNDVTVPPGSWTVKATGPDGLRVSEGVPVTYTAGEKPAPLTLRLVERPGVRGTVTFEDGIKPGSVHVALSLLPEGAEPDPSLLRRAAKSIWIHGHEGYTYKVIDIAPGAYVIGVLVDRRAVVVEKIVVTDGIVVKDLVVPAPDPSEFVFVTVLGPDGKPVPNVSISTAYRSSNRNRSGGGQSVKLPDGRWRVRLRDDDDDEADDADGRHYIRARSGKFGRTEVEYRPGEDREVTVRFVEPGRLHVTISGYQGSGYEGFVRVQLQQRGEGNRPRSTGSDVDMRNDGTAIIGPVVPGAYEIVLTSQLDRHRSTEVARYPVTVVAGENEKTVGMPPLYTLTVIAEGEYAKKRFSLRSSERAVRVWGEKPTNGKLVFRGLPAGTYSISLQNDRTGGMMTVTVPGQTTVRFQPKTPNALSVRITDPDGHFAKAGLQTGDLVIGVNGTEFKDMRDMQMRLFMGADEPARMLVLRGGRRVEITVDLKPMMEGEVKPGADMDPVAR